MLLDGSHPRHGALLSPGALAGGRHIGQLIRILQRNRITPDRYTVRTLNEALSETLPVRRETDDPKRDRLAVFAWKLGKLAERRPGPTSSSNSAAKPQNGSRSAESSRNGISRPLCAEKSTRKPPSWPQKLSSPRPGVHAAPGPRSASATKERL